MTISKRRRHRNRPKRKAARQLRGALRDLIDTYIYGPSLVEQIVPAYYLAINRGL